MILDDFGSKLEIIACAKANFTVEKGKYVTMINPTEYKLSTQVNYNSRLAKGNSSTQSQFSSICPQTLALSFTLDGTGVTGTSPDTDKGVGALLDFIPNPVSGLLGGTVEASVKHFLDVCRDSNGGEHRPNLVKINWGDLLFKGVFISADIDYTHFKPNGQPLRAKISAQFKGSVDPKARLALQDDTSPDLTHVHIVKAGDNLPALAFKVYGDSAYYTEVAKVNQLGNFRRLKVGQTLIFPPLTRT